jgi:hypothetical protein
MINNRIEIFWLNAKDSLHHAFDHFQELETNKNNTWHHEKWIILSVHHAATCIANMWLLEIGENTTLEFPSLISACEKLNNIKDRISETQLKLLILFRRLNDIRNEIMHRLPPNRFEQSLVSFAAMSVLGIFKVMEFEKQKSFEELFNEYSENCQSITEAIHYSRFEEYNSLMETILHEQDPKTLYRECPYCGAQTVNLGECKACYAEIEEVTCNKCGCEFLIVSNFPFDQKCPSCG